MSCRDTCQREHWCLTCPDFVPEVVVEKVYDESVCPKCPQRGTGCPGCQILEFKEN